MVSVKYRDKKKKIGWKEGRRATQIVSFLPRKVNTKNYLTRKEIFFFHTTTAP